jgi:hypothetical protein
MLPFGVIQIEQSRALQQKAAPLFLPEICRTEFPLFTRFSPGCKHAKLNRQIPELNHAVTLRKQTAETHSNRQKIQKCALALRAFDEEFATHNHISTRFCSKYRMRRNLLKTNDRQISTRGHNRMPRSHEFRPISTKVVIEKL